MRWYEIQYLDSVSYEWHYDGGYSTRLDAIKSAKQINKDNVVYIDIVIYKDDEVIKTTNYYTNIKNYTQYVKETEGK